MLGKFGPGRAGTLPEEFALMPNLTYLNVSQNALQGTLPVSYANLSTMQFLDLSGNNFSGELAHSDKSDLPGHCVSVLSGHSAVHNLLEEGKPHA
jgi:Leucine-rich repeat (LRR) protein